MMIEAFKAVDSSALDEIPASDVLKLIRWADGFSWDTEMHPLCFATPDRVIRTGLKHVFGEEFVREIDPDYGSAPRRELSEQEARRASWARKSKKLAPIVSARDGARCNHCGIGEQLTVDHIVPLSRGGSNDLDNLQLLCKSCNSSKGARTMAEWIGAQ